ncbi:TPA: RHS domain-containing protein [Stenotrophomonas maltophilia]|nr:RHS domain-containing protein [Stenotrophomonas maltophilia]HEL3779860.1 RHS domain-containing protein [Stenotrophomonas maltophilia]HEL5005411.1 RHS domain-containing protein [Stenotrophomonas maltophilia]
MNGLSLLLIRVVLALVVLAACVAPAAAQEVVEYIHTDALGSPVAITDANGQVIERTVYEPYGAVVNRPLTDGPGYTGHVTDSETGLSYMQQRYMDPAVGAFLSVDPVTVEGGDMRHLNRYAYAYNNPYKFKDPDGRCPQCLWGAPIGAVVNIGVQMAMAEGSVGERFSQVKWGQVAVATAAGALSGGVSAIANTAATTGGTIAANVVGNAAVGAVSAQANAQLDGKTASLSEVAKGAALSGGTAGLGAAVSAAPGVAARSASAGMTQTERVATGNLMQGIKEATPGFKYSNPVQTAANAVGAAVSSSGDLEPLVNDKLK